MVTINEVAKAAGVSISTISRVINQSNSVSLATKNKVMEAIRELGYTPNISAKKDNKKILIQIGGNWCVWCLRFNHLVTTDPELKAILEKKYLYYHLNYSPENKNEKAFAKYGNPGETYGYPAFLVLDTK